MRASTTEQSPSQSDAEFYDTYGVLDDIIDEPVEFAIDDKLRQEIVGGKRRRRLRNLSLKIDPLQLQALKRIATSKGIPYQTLVRQWLVEKIKKELKIA